GVPIYVGEQKIEWTLSGGRDAPRLREKISVSTTLETIPSNAKILAIHIYPNETVFVETAEWLPDERPNGAPK
ncbi:MAG: hypothetical protein NTY70_19135, partial [Burkholderiales bacterium]|nr:hypothetical protein [Burkholderiales bacterium]